MENYFSNVLCLWDAFADFLVVIKLMNFYEQKKGKSSTLFSREFSEKIAIYLICRVSIKN